MGEKGGKKKFGSTTKRNQPEIKTKRKGRRYQGRGIHEEEGGCVCECIASNASKKTLQLKLKLKLKIS